MSLAVLVAAPSVRTLCPPDLIEGRWTEIPAHVEQVEFAGNGADAPATLVARPSGRMQRRPSDGATATVWEIRLSDDWPTPP